MRKVSQIAVCSVLYVLFAAAFKAYALDMEYITYNGFDPIVAAFQKVALIFSDNSYKALFFSVIVAGMLGGVISVLAKAAGGAKTSAIAWAFPVGIGVVLYLGLFIPQGTLTIYDEAKNRSQTVTLPDGIVAVAGLFNTIEHGLVEIVQTASDPLSYMQNAGGIGFDMLANLGSKGVMLSDKNIMANLRSYTEDCMLFEMQRPGTTLTTNNLGNNTDFMALYELAANPSNYTTVYNDTHPEGTTATCTVAWEGLKADLNNNTKYDNVTKSKCADAGFDPANATELNQCKTLLASTTNWLYGATYTYVQLFRQTLMATAINDALMSASPDTAAMVLASRNTGTSMVSSGIVANQWIPVIKGVLTAVAIGIIPILVIFIPTPLFSKALSIICGFFIWLAVWGVTDAIIHTFGMDYAKKVYDEVAQHQLGTVAIMNFGTSSLKALAAFGAIRWAGLMLATVITGMLVRFGGHAVAQLAGQLTSSVQHGGGSAGMAAVTPEGRAQELQKLEGAPTVMTNAHRFSFAERSAIKTAELTGRTSGMASLLREQGQAGLAQMIAQSTKGSMIRNAALGNAAQYMGTDAFISNATKNQIAANATGAELDDNELAEKVGRLNQQQKIGSVKALEETAKRYGMDVKQFTKSMVTGNATQVAEAGAVYQNYVKQMDGRDISHEQAIIEMAHATGQDKAAGNIGTQRTYNTVGFRDMVNAKTQMLLNPASKMIAQSEYGVASGRMESMEDDKGAYNVHKAHHQEESYNLQSDKDVAYLNEQATKQGLKTRFKLGDRVSVSWIKDNNGNLNVMVAKANAGYSKEQVDITNETKGRKSSYYDLNTSETGTRGSHGNRNERYDINSFEGKREIMGPNNEKMTVYGKWQEDGKGNVIAGEYTNSLNNRVVYEHAVLTGYEGGDQNKPIYHKQFAVADRVMTAKGQLVTAHTRNLSKEELSKNGFAVNTTIGPNGERLYSSAVRGNQATDVNKILIDQQSEAKFSFASRLFKQGQDFTNISDTQALALFTAEGMKKLADIVPTAISVKRGLGDLISKTKGINSDGGSGGSISNADIKDMQKYDQRVESTKIPAYDLYKDKPKSTNSAGSGNSKKTPQSSGSQPEVQYVTSAQLKQMRQQKSQNPTNIPQNTANSIVSGNQQKTPASNSNRSLENMLFNQVIPLISNKMTSNEKTLAPTPGEAANNLSPRTVKQQYPTTNGQSSNPVPSPNPNVVSQPRPAGGTQPVGTSQPANMQGVAPSPTANQTQQSSNPVPSPNPNVVSQPRPAGGTQPVGTSQPANMQGVAPSPTANQTQQSSNPVPSPNPNVVSQPRPAGGTQPVGTSQPANMQGVAPSPTANQTQQSSNPVPSPNPNVVSQPRPAGGTQPVGTSQPANMQGVAPSPTANQTQQSSNPVPSPNPNVVSQPRPAGGTQPVGTSQPANMQGVAPSPTANQTQQSSNPVPSPNPNVVSQPRPAGGTQPVGTSQPANMQGVAPSPTANQTQQSSNPVPSPNPNVVSQPRPAGGTQPVGTSQPANMQGVAPSPTANQTQQSSNPVPSPNPNVVSQPRPAGGTQPVGTSQPANMQGVAPSPTANQTQQSSNPVPSPNPNVVSQPRPAGGTQPVGTSQPANMQGVAPSPTANQTQQSSNPVPSPNPNVVSQPRPAGGTQPVGTSQPANMQGVAPSPTANQTQQSSNPVPSPNPNVVSQPRPAGGTQPVGTSQPANMQGVAPSPTANQTQQSSNPVPSPNPNVVSQPRPAGGTQPVGTSQPANMQGVAPSPTANQTQQSSNPVPSPNPNVVSQPRPAGGTQPVGTSQPANMQGVAPSPTANQTQQSSNPVPSPNPNVVSQPRPAGGTQPVGTSQPANMQGVAPSPTANQTQQSSNPVPSPNPNVVSQPRPAGGTQPVGTSQPANMQGVAPSPTANQTQQSSNPVPSPNPNVVSQPRPAGGTQPVGTSQPANMQGVAPSPTANQTQQSSNPVPSPNPNVVSQPRPAGGTQPEKNDTKIPEKNVLSNEQTSSTSQKQDSQKTETAKDDAANNVYTKADSSNYATDAQVVNKEQYEEIMKQKSIDNVKEFLNNNNMGRQQNAEQFYEYLSNKYGNDKANEMIQSYAGQNYNQELLHELQSYAQQTNIMQSEAKQAHDGYASAEIESNSSNMDNKKEQQTAEHNIPKTDMNRADSANNIRQTAQNDGIKSMYAATIATTTGGINYATDAQVAGGKQYEKQKPIDILKEFMQQNAEQFYEHLSNKYGNDKANEMIQSYAGHNYNQELMHELQSYAQQTNIMQSEAKQAHDGYASAEIESNSSNMDNKKEQQTAEHNIPKTDMNRADSANNIRQDDLEHAQETNNANPSTETHSEVKQQGSVSTKSMNDQANNNTIDQMISNYTYGANDIAAPDVAQFLDEQTQAIPNPDMNRLDSETPSQDTRLSQNSMPNSYEEPPVYATENKTDTITESTSNTNTPYDLFQPKASSSKAADNHITQLTREMLEREKTNTSMANIEPIPGGSVGVEYKQTGDVNREVIPGGNTEPIPGGNSDGIQGVPGGKKI